MKIMLTNDDGVLSPGIIELAQLLRQDSEVFVVAPRIEQSGISQAITFKRPLFPIKLADSDPLGPGYSVNGTPADCAKLGIHELCPFKPDLVVSGINGGLNAGVNVCYSGTVGGAFVASTFDIPSIAISAEYSEQIDFVSSAVIARQVVHQCFVKGWPNRTVANVNIPTSAISEATIGKTEVVVVPVELNPLGYGFDKGIDPKGRKYFWSNNAPDPVPSNFETDCSALKQGKVTVSPISYDPNAVEATEYFKDAIAAKAH